MLCSMTEPKTVPMAAESVEDINSFIANNNTHRILQRGDVIVIPGVMWARASGDTRTVFQNLCKIWRLKHRDGTSSSTEPFIERGNE